MKDEKIRYRTAEREALVAAGVTAFCLASGNLRSTEMAEVFIRHRDVVWEKAVEGGGDLGALAAAGAAHGTLKRT